MRALFTWFVLIFARAKHWLSAAGRAQRQLERKAIEVWDKEHPETKQTLGFFERLRDRARFKKMIEGFEKLSQIDNEVRAAAESEFDRQYSDWQARFYATAGTGIGFSTPPSYNQVLSEVSHAREAERNAIHNEHKIKSASDVIPLLAGVGVTFNITPKQQT